MFLLVIVYAVSLLLFRLFVHLYVYLATFDHLYQTFHCLVAPINPFLSDQALLWNSNESS